MKLMPPPTGIVQGDGIRLLFNWTITNGNANASNVSFAEGFKMFLKVRDE